MTTHHEGHDPCASFPSVRHLRTTFPIATKEHLCTICSGAIPPRTRHHCIEFYDCDARAFRRSRFHISCPEAQS